ncbi:MAG TPA: rod shape-determining protein MreD [Melioribacteraceae bacterium]|nr:rod shape-determining protein MreD [Melioribacteraceae bacterium]
MIKSFVFPLLIFIPLLILQLTVIPLISYNNIVPDLIILPVVYFAVKKGQRFGMLLGFVLGLLFDLFSGGLIGPAMFSKTITGFIAGYFYNENKIDLTLGSAFFMVIVLICASIDSLFYSLFSVTENLSTFTTFLIKRSIFPGLYTSAFSLPSIIYNNKVEKIR